jgi:hypothetical protein
MLLAFFIDAKTSQQTAPHKIGVFGIISAVLKNLASLYVDQLHLTKELIKLGGLSK